MASRRWSQEKEGKVLCSLFDNNLADPRFVKPADIDPIKGLSEVFEGLSADQFRNNYKKTATKWVTAKAISGTRKENLDLGVKEKTDAAANNNDNEEEKDQEEIAENVVEEVKPPPPTKNMSVPAKQQQQQPPQTRAAGAYKYKDDEKRWDAVHQSSKFISKGYIRDELIIEPPACFDGTEGTYQVGFDNDNRVLVVKIAPNPVFNDPHTINSYYAKMYGIMTADDSARNQAFKASARRIADKWYTFRYQLDWPGKPSEDLGMVPWIDYADFQAEGRQFPLLNLYE